MEKNGNPLDKGAPKLAEGQKEKLFRKVMIPFQTKHILSIRAVHCKILFTFCNICYLDSQEATKCLQKTDAR